MKVNIFSIPSYAGALYKGTEEAPEAMRKAGLSEKLRGCGYQVRDNGDLDSYNDLPRHNTPPVRNWPAPRIVWESILNNTERLFDKNSFTILLGGDCSIEVGSFSAFRKVYGDNSYLLVLDGHVDLMAPQGDISIGAAGMGLWFLTQDNFAWWSEKEKISPSNISVIGVQEVPGDCRGINAVSLKDIKNDEELSQIKLCLNSIPQDANILVHFDVDMLNKNAMAAAYSPSEEGLNFEEALNVFKLILSDCRVKAMEVTEFTPDKDDEAGSAAAIVVDLICQLKNRE